MFSVIKMYFYIASLLLNNDIYIYILQTTNTHRHNKVNKLLNYNFHRPNQSGARKTGPPSRRPTWAYFLDSVQEFKQMQITYWLEKVLKMISLYVNALLCTLQHVVVHAMQLSGVNTCIACMTICCSVHKSALTYKEIIFSTFSNQ